MTRLQEARAAVKAAQAAISAGEARAAKARAALDPVRKRRDRAHQALAKVPALIIRPGDRVAHTTLDCVSLSWLNVEDAQALAAIPASKRTAAVSDLLRAGTVKVNLAGEGTALTVKGLAAKTHTVDRAALARIARARKASDAAQAAAHKARAAYEATLKREWADGSSCPSADLAEKWGAVIAADLAAKALIEASRGSNVSWEDRNALEAATAHLAHVESKSKDPCPCGPCAATARAKDWAARQEADAKAQAKALASARKVSFTCPLCGQTSITTVDGDRVRCRNRSCSSNLWGASASGLALDSVKTTRQPKNATVGLVATATGG